MNFLLDTIGFDLPNLLGLTAVLFAIVFLRYLLLSGTYHALFFVVLRKRFQQRFLHLSKFISSQAKREIGRSAIGSLVFALSGVAVLLLWQNGHTQIYTDWHDYPNWYVPVSLLIALFLHETYYYWLHRWMHLPKVYRKIHHAHHESMETSVLTSFSFHPIESVLQAVFVPVALLFLPIHVYVLLFWLVLMTVSALVNHAGVEVYPAAFKQHWLMKYLIGATHHDRHHKRFRYNFGLYFTCWDRWMKTESPD